jgi:hypothetical protein
MALRVRMVFIGHSQRAQVMRSARLGDFQSQPVPCLKPTVTEINDEAGIEKTSRDAPICLDTFQLRSSYMYFAATNIWNDNFYLEDDHPMVLGMASVPQTAALPAGMTNYHLACLYALQNTKAGEAKIGRLLSFHHQKMFASLALHKERGFPQPAQQLKFDPLQPTYSDNYTDIPEGVDGGELQFGGASQFAVDVEERQMDPNEGSTRNGSINRQLATFFQAPEGSSAAQRKLYMRGLANNPEGKTTNMQDLRHNLVTSKYLAWFNNTQFKDMNYEEWKTFICGHMNTGAESLETTYISVPIIKIKKHLLVQQTSHYGAAEGGSEETGSDEEEDEDEEAVAE